MSSQSGPTSNRDMVSRREFLRVGGLSVVGMSVGEQSARAQSKSDRRSCIFLLMTGGPSPFETFHPRPNAPAEIRGPASAIPTAIPGVALSESLPLLAARAKQFALVRSVSHAVTPIHETGLQLLQTGRLSEGTRSFPSIGSLVSKLIGPRGDVAPYVVLPRRLTQTGVNTYRGQMSGCLGEKYEPLELDVLDRSAVSPTGRSAFGTFLGSEPANVRRAYGDTRFGRLCLAARQLVECGVRCVVVNLFDQLQEQMTWDCHASAPSAPARVHDCVNHLCPQFDRALAALIDDLRSRGMLDETLVVAAGEMGRTPYLNSRGGRDHWPHVWSALFAGGGVAGGQVIGATDAYGGFPVDRPVHPAEIPATVFQSLGLPSTLEWKSQDGVAFPLSEYKPIAELLTSSFKTV